MLKVSIIIPTYNRAQLVRDALESCLKQTYRDVEIIVVDDGSSDGTEQSIKDFLLTHSLGPVSDEPRRSDDCGCFSWRMTTECGKTFLYVRQSNGGVARARQAGCLAATGDYIQFLDSDDILFESKISLQVEALSKAVDPAVDCCLCRGVKGDASREQADATPIGICARDSADALSLLAFGPPFALHTMAPLWRHAFLLGQRGWPEDLICGEDVLYFARLFKKCGSIVSVDKPLFWLRDHHEARATVGQALLGSAAKIKSALLSTRRLYVEIRNSPAWSDSCLNGFLDKARGGYWLALHALDDKELVRYEGFCLRLARQSQRREAFTYLFALRRIIGSRMLRALLGAVLSLKRARFMRKTGD